MGVVTLVAEILFGFLFVATLVSYVRRRDVLSRDVMFIFASVAALFGVIGINAVVGRLPDAVLGASILLLLAQPLLILHMAHRLRPVPWLVRMAGLAAFVITGIPFVLIPLRLIGPAVVPAAVTYVVTDLAAAFFLAREAARRVGSARVRLAAAAAGSATMALALGLVGTQLPVSSDLGRILILGAATLFVLGFMPPAWVRKVWNAVATYEFTEELSDATGGEQMDTTWSRAAEICRRLTGASVALVVGGGRARILAMAGAAQLLDLVGEEPLAELPAGGSEGASGAQTKLAELGQALGAPHVSIVHFGGDGSEPGALILFRPHPSLFAADDHAIVEAIVSRAAVFAERGQALAEQAALAERLRLTVQALEQASKAKSDFLASMSHELRTPLSAIIGFSALMRDEPMDGSARRVPDEWIAHIHNSGEHLLALINDVLDLTKIEAGRIELQREPFDLPRALTESAEGLRPLADKKRISMSVIAEDGVINADRGRLRQMVYNLLSNAIKFTPDGGTIRLEACWDGTEARIAVIDSGVGIAADDLERIFQEFSQVGDMKAREAGTGLGLALTRRLAEAHGGHVVVQSVIGEGSRFELRLPETRTHGDTATASPVVAAQGASAPTVLVIEDDPGAVRLLDAYLGGEGYELIVATDGIRGIAAAKATLPAAIILDVLLPGIDGWEVLRRLKADETTRDIPVIVATVVDERNVAMSLGAVDYFLKPIRPKALLARLSQYTFTTKVKERRVRVLAIDDDPATREMVVNALAPEGFDVVAAASGREALELAAADPPELVICDLVMPDMDGFEVVSRLQANEATRNSTILILTGQDLTASDRERLNGKVADVLNKGDDPRPAFARWLERASKAADRRQLAEELAAG
jgi:signal transduction histidine kinase/CheY-like chemotaxis protein